MLKAPIPSHQCRKFASCFAPGVVDVVKNARTGHEEVKVRIPFFQNILRLRPTDRLSTHAKTPCLVKFSGTRTSRDWWNSNDNGIFSFVSHHDSLLNFLFIDNFPVNVESEGPYPPEELLSEAIATIRQKIKVVRQAAQQLQVDMTIDT